MNINLEPCKFIKTLCEFYEKKNYIEINNINSKTAIVTTELKEVLHLLK